MMDDFSDDESAVGGKKETAPLFLRKVYQMLETCDQRIACWSENGDSFFINDPEAFAQKVIPQFFNHSNISSFIRQCNFYQFRKVSKLKHPGSKIWEFKNDRFIRGKPHLLSSIKRATHGATDQEVVLLKDEVGHLKTRIREMSSSIDKLTTLVNDLMVDKWERDTHQKTTTTVTNSVTAAEGGGIPTGAAVAAATAASSIIEDPVKRKRAPQEEVSSSQGSEFVPIKTEFPGPYGSNNMMEDEDILSRGSELTFDENGTLIVGPESFNPFTSNVGYLDMNLGGASEPDHATMAISPPISPRASSASSIASSSSSSAAVSSSAASALVMPGLGQQRHHQPIKSEEEELAALQQTLVSLSPEHQHKLVETLKESLATSSTSQSSQTMASSSSNAAPVGLPLASAALGAFIAEYAKSRRMEEIPKPQPPPGTRKAIRSQG